MKSDWLQARIDADITRLALIEQNVDALQRDVKWLRDNFVQTLKNGGGGMRVPTLAAGGGAAIVVVVVEALRMVTG